MSERKSSSKNGKNTDPATMSDPEMQKVHAQLMREKEEPREGFPPVPIYLLFLFSIIIFICGIYMGEKSAGFRWDIYDPNFDPADLERVDEKPAFDPIARGQRVYSQQCTQCHQASGQGVPGTYPPLVDSSWVNDTRVVPISILLHGLSGEIEVGGNTYNGLMPSFTNLSDRDIASVLSYIRQEWGNAAGMISEEQVAEVRERESGRASPWSAAELLELAPVETPLPESEGDAENGGEAEDSESGGENTESGEEGEGTEDAEGGDSESEAPEGEGEAESGDGDSGTSGEGSEAAGDDGETGGSRTGAEDGAPESSRTSDEG